MKKKVLSGLIAFLVTLTLILSSCGENEEGAATGTETAEVTTGFSFESIVMPETTGAVTETEKVTDTESETETESDAATETQPDTEEPPVTTPPAPVNTGDPNDVQPPFFLYFASNVTLNVGWGFDVHSYVSYIDDCDPDVILTVDGELDTATVGEYPLTLTLKDHSGNASSSVMNVRVKEPAPAGSGGTTDPTPTLPQKTFAEFSATYKREGTSVGIDVSRWQGEIDFGKVAAAGCEFVIMRIGGYADGTFEDPRFAENIKGAKAAGLKVGVYWYSEENGPAAVRKNAAYLYSLLNGEKLDFPIFFDWEDYYHFEDYKMSMRDLNDMFLAFRDEAESRGYKAALYNSPYYLRILWSDEVKNSGVWLAHYVDETSYEGSYFLWQQGIGRIDGINADVDVD
ncbi:MAG: hypothetical protein IJU75_01540, partial [Clostridia bacterium]|nr:hypothetical protein [Clostridia bacterium]